MHQDVYKRQMVMMMLMVMASAGAVFVMFMMVLMVVVVVFMIVMVFMVVAVIDVYKRQLSYTVHFYSLSSGQLLPLLLLHYIPNILLQSSLHERLAPAHEPEPVSYTHLDVYKRQLDCLADCRL